MFILSYYVKIEQGFILIYDYDDDKVVFYVGLMYIRDLVLNMYGMNVGLSDQFLSCLVMFYMWLVSNGFVDGMRVLIISLFLFQR